jgi:hypothetical protein
MITWILERRYFFLSLFVFYLVFAHAQRGQWQADFWEHAAVVRELSTNPADPRHPQLTIEAPHAFSSPYNLAVAPSTFIMAISLGGLCLYRLSLRKKKRWLLIPVGIIPLLGLLTHPLTFLFYGTGLIAFIYVYGLVAEKFSHGRVIA